VQSATDARAMDPVEALVQRAQDGDATSFAKLYELFYDKIFRYVRFKTGSSPDAEDIEEVFLRMLESIQSFKWKSHPFSSWLFRIAHNLIVDYFRKGSRHKTAPLEEARDHVGASAIDMDQRLDTKLSVERVQRVMVQLTDLQKEIMSLRFGAGLSVRETAEATGKNENAVKASQHAAVKKLRTLLGAVSEKTANRAMQTWSR